jgi:hypothetical protein
MIKTKVLNSLVILILLSLVGKAQQVKHTVKLYPYYISPEEYPDFERRPFVTPTWKTFNDTVQFVGGRNWGQVYGMLSETAPNWLEGGTVLRPNFSIFKMSPDSLAKSLTALKNSGKFLFNINAYGPGSPARGSFGQFQTEQWKVNMMQEILGDRYLGFDLGEQDGRYWADCRSIDYPFSEDYTERYIRQMRYMQRAAKDQGNVISMLSVKGFWHYPMKDGYITISGAESQNKTHTSNNQVHYSFLRGASKQYGLLWYGDISVFNTWGWKKYGDSLGNDHDPVKGNSISWMKRMLLSQYQYNSTILGFETSKFYTSGAEKNKLSPIGKLQKDAQDFVKKYPKPGPQYVPVAFLLDFFSGWMTPSVPHNDKYKVWNYLPYTNGDYFTHELLGMFYPGYDLAGLRKDEYGGLCNTPYGDAVDVLLSDAKVATLNQYSVVVIAGEIKTDPLELSEKLDSYVSNGGHLIITGNNAGLLFPTLYNASNKKDLKIKHITVKRGKISIIPHQNMGLKVDNSLDTGVRSYLDSTFRRTKIFDVSNDSLGYITTIEKDGRYILGIYNHSLKPSAYNIKSLVGDIKSIKELTTSRELRHEIGYYPEGFEDAKNDVANKENLLPGEVKLFEIQLKNQSIVTLPKTTQEPITKNKYLLFDAMIGMSEKIQKMPTFFDHFSGAFLNWKAINEIDSLQLLEDCWWYNLKKMQIAIEFDESFLLFSINSSGEYQHFMKKMAMFNNVGLIVAPLQKKPELKDLLNAAFSNAQFIDSTTFYKHHFTGSNNEKSKLNKTEPLVIKAIKDNWDDIYLTLKGINVSKKSSSKSSKLLASDKEPFKSVESTTNKNRIYLSYHKIDVDLTLYINENYQYITQFEGIKIDGSYLMARSESKCIEEAAAFNKTNLKLVVDLSRELNHFPDLTWVSEIEHAYERSEIWLQNVLNKMKLMGIDMVIINSHMRPEVWDKSMTRSAEESIKSGMYSFIQKAANLNINVCIQNMQHTIYPGRMLASPKEVRDLVIDAKKKYGNVGLAANLRATDKPSSIVNDNRDLISICIVNPSGSNSYDYSIPIFKSEIKYTPQTDKKTILILDADYKNFEEIMKDKAILDNMH